MSVPVAVGRGVELFLSAVDELAPGLVTGFYLVGSVALDDFQVRGAGRGRLSTTSDIDFVAEGHRGYRNPLARRRDTLAFLDTTIDAALALP